MQLCLHHILRDEVGGDGIVVLLPLGDELLLVVRTTKVADNLLPKRRKKTGNCILCFTENFSADSLGYWAWFRPEYTWQSRIETKYHSITCFKALMSSICCRVELSLRLRSTSWKTVKCMQAPIVHVSNDSWHSNNNYLLQKCANVHSHTH